MEYRGDADDTSDLFSSEGLFTPGPGTSYSLPAPPAPGASSQTAHADLLSPNTLSRTMAALNEMDFGNSSSPLGPGLTFPWEAQSPTSNLPFPALSPCVDILQNNDQARAASDLLAGTIPWGAPSPGLEGFSPSFLSSLDFLQSHENPSIAQSAAYTRASPTQTSYPAPSLSPRQQTPSNVDNHLPSTVSRRKRTKYSTPPTQSPSSAVSAAWQQDSVTHLVQAPPLNQSPAFNHFPSSDSGWPPASHIPPQSVSSAPLLQQSNPFSQPAPDPAREVSVELQPDWRSRDALGIPPLQLPPKLATKKGKAKKGQKSAPAFPAQPIAPFVAIPEGAETAFPAQLEEARQMAAFYQAKILKQSPARSDPAKMASATPANVPATAQKAGTRATGHPNAQPARTSSHMSPPSVDMQGYRPDTSTLEQTGEVQETPEEGLQESCNYCKLQGLVCNRKASDGQLCYACFVSGEKCVFGEASEEEDEEEEEETSAMFQCNWCYMRNLECDGEGPDAPACSECCKGKRKRKCVYSWKDGTSCDQCKDRRFVCEGRYSQAYETCPNCAIGIRYCTYKGKPPLIKFLPTKAEKCDDCYEKGLLCEGRGKNGDHRCWHCRRLVPKQDCVSTWHQGTACDPCKKEHRICDGRWVRKICGGCMKTGVPCTYDEGEVAPWETVAGPSLIGRR